MSAIQHPVIVHIMCATFHAKASVFCQPELAIHTVARLNARHAQLLVQHETAV